MGLKSCFKSVIKRIDVWLEICFWRISSASKLYLVAIGCILDELTMKWWQRTPIKTQFPDNKAVGKVAIVTGGATGIGLNICKGLCHFNYKVIIAGRNEGRGSDAVKTVMEEIPTADIKFMYCDLSSFKSIETFSAKYKQSNLPINLLVNNAGVMLCPHWTTQNGFEQQLGVNYIGHVYLTNLLLDTIKTSGTSDHYARIVNVSSEAYSVGTINFNNLNSSFCYSSHAAYCQSKLALNMWTFKLQRELQKEHNCYVSVNAVHPGVISTNLYRHANILVRTGKTIVSKVLKSPHQGAYVCVYAGVSKELEGLGGNYVRECKVARTTSESIDVDKQDQLWDVTHKMIAAAQAGKSVL